MNDSSNNTSTPVNTPASSSASVPSRPAIEGSPADAPSRGERLRRLRIPLMLGGSLVIVLVAAYLYFKSGRTESTSDAYVSAARVAISTNVPGRVIELRVHDNQRVKRGEVLFRLDDRPFQLAVNAARAKLGNTRMQVDSLKATYRQKQSELKSAEDTLAFEQNEMDRQKRLLASGISSQSQLDRAAHARDAAAQQVAATHQEISGVVANLGGDPSIDLTKHPAVEQAQAELDRALLDLSYTTITAPDDGIVAQVERLQVGDYVNAANPVFALVSTHNLWIEANFKEVQLSKMRAGQSATVEIDTYGDKTFKAHVASLSPGTGAQFSVLPAQNATGNWVKVVQRLAVRIEIDDADRQHPLFAGLSATVKVDTHDRNGAPLADEEPATPPANVERVAVSDAAN